MLQPSSRRRERILTFGVGGSGKSHAYVQIARDMVGSGRTMYLIETDPTLDAVLEHPDFEDVGAREAWRLTGDTVEPDETWADYLDADGCIVVYRATDWPGVRNAMEDVWSRAEFDDWIVVDNITGPWEWVQTWYWQEVVGQDTDEFLLQIRKAQLEQDQGDSSKAIESKFNEWSFINPHFQKHFTDRILNPPCHLYLSAEQTDVVKHFDEKQKETWGLYGMLGTKPKGQKKSGHLTHTVLHLSKARTGEYKMTTVKDRGGRTEWNRADWTDFTFDYLQETAGWQQTTATSTRQAEAASLSSQGASPARAKPSRQKPGKPRSKPA